MEFRLDTIEAVADSLPDSPYQVMRPLSRTASPAQLDSAFHTWLKPELISGDKPSSILFYTEYPSFQHGVAGDPVPYTLRDDNAVSALLLFSFIFFILALAKLRTFMARQVKNIVYPSYNDGTINETGGEFRLQIFLVVLMCLPLSLTTYQYVTFYTADAFMVDNEFMLVVILFFIFAAYYLLKTLLYALVNYIFFDSSQSVQWLKTALFINAFQSILLFPVIMIIINFNFSSKIELCYFAFVLFFVKTLTIYKSWDIFFRQNGVFLQTFLYFCALEIVPVLSLISGLAVLTDHLKINF